MKLGKVFLSLAFFVLSAQLLFAQTPNNNSSVKIEIKNHKYIVSGAVSSDAVKDEIIGKVNEISRNNAEFSGLKVDLNADPFAAGWQKDFDKSLFKSKLWKSGVFIFTTKRAAGEYPDVPDEILNARIILIDAVPARLASYRNKAVIVFFLAHWCQPCIRQAEELNSFYAENWEDGSVEIIGINVDTDENEQFKKFVRARKFRYDMAEANENLYRAALKISKFQGIPQAFLIRDGKLYGIFFGNSPNTVKKLKETILEVSKMR
ncbi:MAG TPA: TlpA disulfide reductase family protein [Pyrinomonadaceae bacterium]|nr:TlpA disulfide reductase family protein [Pyrinomonadaceae bacterium]